MSGDEEEDPEKLAEIKRLERLKLGDVPNDLVIGTTKAWAEAFTIFAKYESDGHVAAEHDEVFAGPESWMVVSDQDLVRLSALGWLPNTDVNGFSKFT